MTKFTAIGVWLRRRAENVSVALLATMFVAFLIQIFFRYFSDFPIGWTHELSIVTWIWLVLWGAAFVVREDEEIRFDLLYGNVRPGTRRVMAIVTAVALIALYAVSLPGVVDYVAFMKVQETAYLDIRFDFLFSIYIVFVVASIARYLWLGWRALRGEAPEAPQPDKAISGL